MKYIFFGTPNFARTILQELITAGFMPQAIVCNPDPPPLNKGGGLSPVKVLAENYKIFVLQPENIKTEYFIKEIKSFEPDLIIIAAYGKIIPKAILDIPKYGAVNVHASLLPTWRGASPIQYAILNGDKETGITIMLVDEQMDHGPILAKSKILISELETQESLSEKLADLGAKILIKKIPAYINNKIKPRRQNHSNATYTKMVLKEDGKIVWSKNAAEIERMVRAFYPWPSAWTAWNGKLLKILKAGVLENTGHKIGEVFMSDKKTAVGCGNGALIIEKLQLEGGKILTAQEFLNGHQDFPGSILR